MILTNDNLYVIIQMRSSSKALFHGMEVKYAVTKATIYIVPEKFLKHFFFLFFMLCNSNIAWVRLLSYSHAH